MTLTVTLPTPRVSAVSPAKLTDSLRHRGEGALRMSVRRNLGLAAKSEHTWLDQPAATSSPIPDHVLLCCFGPELAGSRNHKQLSTALQQAGYADVRYLDGHMSGWEKAGLPLETASPD